tara:strand:+ start:771 stop:887 length:117 start_codon:yes stop_codon:yes gene_type:complete
MKKNKSTKDWWILFDLMVYVILLLLIAIAISAYINNGK